MKECIKMLKRNKYIFVSLVQTSEETCCILHRSDHSLEYCDLDSKYTNDVINILRQKGILWHLFKVNNKINLH